MLKRYTFKLYPTARQETALREQARLCAILWNALLEMRETHYRRAKQREDKKTSLTAFDQGKDITALNAAAKMDPDLAEWRAIPRGTQERVADMLDLAMKAFFKRAKGGAGAQSGYPRYKSTRHADSVPLREPVKSCWKFEPKNSNGGCPSADFSKREKRENSSIMGGCGQSGAEALHSEGGDRIKCRRLANQAGAEALHSEGGDRRRPDQTAHRRGAEALHSEGGDRRIEPFLRGACGADALHSEGGDRDRPAARGAEALRSKNKKNLDDRNWRFEMRGIPGRIKARGRFPSTPLAYKTADVKFYAGAWWLSICVDIAERMTSGTKAIRIDMDLIDSFAAVTVNGRCAPGLSNPFRDGRKGEFFKHQQGLQESPCGNTMDVGEAQDGKPRAPACQACGNHMDVGEAQERRCIARRRSACGNPMDVGEAQERMAVDVGDDACGNPMNARESQKDHIATVVTQTDVIQSARDRRYKLGSYRWRKEKQRIAKLKAREARRRKEALHRWTTQLVRAAKEIEVIAPPQRAMRSAKGNEKSPGAEVKLVAALNRHVLSMAPASAIQMLEYKAKEAAIAFSVTRRADHQVTIGTELKKAAVTARRARRVTRRKEKLLGASE